jgi:RHS repeat-associated protein
VDIFTYDVAGRRNNLPAPDSQMKFATYYHDSTIDSQDYANQRYYASTYGPFNSPDPMRNSASLENPGSWNGYAHVLGDPINLRDPVGLCAEDTLHEVYGLDDKAIMNTLKAHDPKAGINLDCASRQITDWMVKDCVTGKGNN